MSLHRTLGVSLGAVLAACSIAAPSSLAAPPEFSPPFPNPFKATSKAMALETIGKFRVTCAAGTSKGEVTGQATAALTITFTGCSTGEGPGGASTPRVAKSSRNCSSARSATSTRNTRRSALTFPTRAPARPAAD
jgi:hypothetical protein